MTRIWVGLGLAAFLLGSGLALADQPEPSATENVAGTVAESFGRVIKSDAEWRRQLTRQQYFVTRLGGTDPAWMGRYARGNWKGIFACIGCEAELFSSNHKYESGTGWPSFWRPIRLEALGTSPDSSTPEFRVEVHCNRCGSHLGHVFHDGPPPTGLRFCINSTSLKLRPFDKPKFQEHNTETGPTDRVEDPD